MTRKAIAIAESEQAARELCAGARTFADEVTLVPMGDAPEGCADKVATVQIPSGAVLDDAAESIAAFVEEQAPIVVLVEPTRRLKVVAGTIAARLGTAVVTDAMSFDDAAAASMYFGGVAERERKPLGSVGIYTVSPGVFDAAGAQGANAPEEISWVAPARPLELVSRVPIEKSSVDLHGADVVVGAGRGFSDKGKLDLARELCDKLGGGLGCTRPLTEGESWLPTELYIGVSGLMLSPKVYVAIGISGQMQHMVGINRSETIFAINKDANAPIFAQCDYGLVGDIDKVLPELIGNL